MPRIHTSSICATNTTVVEGGRKGAMIVLGCWQYELDCQVGSDRFNIRKCHRWEVMVAGRESLGYPMSSCASCGCATCHIVSMFSNRHTTPAEAYM